MFQVAWKGRPRLGYRVVTPSHPNGSWVHCLLHAAVSSRFPSLYDQLLMAFASARGGKQGDCWSLSAKMVPDVSCGPLSRLSCITSGRWMLHDFRGKIKGSLAASMRISGNVQRQNPASRLREAPATWRGHAQESNLRSTTTWAILDI